MVTFPVTIGKKSSDMRDFIDNNLCEGCGNCCTLYPIFGEWEAEDISKFTGLKIEEFADITSPATEDYGALFTTKRAYNSKLCMFLNQNRRCSIYSVAPQNCKDASCFVRNQIIPSLNESDVLTVDDAEAIRDKFGSNRLVDFAESIYMHRIKSAKYEK